MLNPSPDKNNRTISMTGVIDCSILADTDDAVTLLIESAPDYDEYDKPIAGTQVIYQRIVKVESGYEAPVQIKLKATYEQWRDLHHSFDVDETSITFESISSLILPIGKRAEYAANMKHLQDYATTDPAGFAWSIYGDFICVANVLNPLIISKERGGSPYTDIDMKELKRVSRWLYVFLLHWLKQPEASWPEEFQVFLKRHGIKVQDTGLDECDVVERHATALTSACIQKVYRILKTEEENFYKNYVTRRTPLIRIKSILSAVRYSPARYPLKNFLKM